MSQIFVTLQFKIQWSGITFFFIRASVVSTLTQSVGGRGVFVEPGMAISGPSVILLAVPLAGVLPLVISGHDIVGLAVGTFVTPATLSAHPLSLQERVSTEAAVSV